MVNRTSAALLFVLSVLLVTAEATAAPPVNQGTRDFKIVGTIDYVDTNGGYIVVGDHQYSLDKQTQIRLDGQRSGTHVLRKGQTVGINYFSSAARKVASDVTVLPSQKRREDR